MGPPRFAFSRNGQSLGCQCGRTIDKADGGDLMVATDVGHGWMLSSNGGAVAVRPMPARRASSKAVGGCFVQVSTRTRVSYETDQ